MSAEVERVTVDPTRQSTTDGVSGLSRFSWKRTSLALLAACEEKILSYLSVTPESRFVPIFNGTKRIWTISLNQRAAGTPLVLLHGMGSGVALWVLNLGSLSLTRPVYAIDLLGFGRSTRSKFSTDAHEAEMEFVNSIEEWRSAMKLEKMILLGHSLGGYLAASYALHHADRVKHLILADPWGFPPRPTTQEVMIKLPMWAKVVRTIVEPFNPFAVLRAAGPWGPGLVIRFRSDLLRKYSHIFSDERIGEYIYHCNAQPPSGEAAFKSLTHEFGWARRPMIERIHEIPTNLSMTLIYGSRSWVDYGVGYEVKYKRPDSYVNVEVIRESGHHVYADKPEVFNTLVNRACDLVDQHPHPLRPSFPPMTSSSKQQSAGLPSHLQDPDYLNHRRHGTADAALRQRVPNDRSSTTQQQQQSSIDKELHPDQTQDDVEEDIVSGGR